MSPFKTFWLLCSKIEGTLEDISVGESWVLKL